MGMHSFKVEVGPLGWEQRIKTNTIGVISHFARFLGVLGDYFLVKIIGREPNVRRFDEKVVVVLLLWGP